MINLDNIYLVHEKASIEQLGTKEKFWFKDKETDVNCLFKVGRPGTGEDWVEVMVAHIFNLLNIPHATYQFAKYDLQFGTVSESFVPNGARLIHGNELLAKIHEEIGEEYDMHTFYKVKAYKLRTILLLLKTNLVLPADNISKYTPCTNPAEMFIGYLIVDCLVSNQDRHHENWGLIINGKTIYLAPSYDHASGLGSKASDEEKEKRLSTNDQNYTVAAYVKKAKTPFYEKGKLLKTIETIEICAKMNKEATLMWLDKIERLDINQINDIFRTISDDLISGISKKFALEMIKENKKRLVTLKKEIENEY